MKIAVIVGSVRPGRAGLDVANWYIDQVKDTPGLEFELVDLKDHPLPLLDEPMPPAMGQYEKAHTKAWSEVISRYDGYVWVTSEYNHAPPASLLNAISYLFNEWSKKPVAMVGYGNMAGARAVEHLRNVAGELDMVDLRMAVGVRNPWTITDKSSKN